MIRNLAVYLGTPSGGLVLLAVAAALLAVLWFAARAAGRTDRVGALLVAFFFMELGAAAIFLSLGFDEMSQSDSNPRLVPICWGLALFVCALIQFVKVWRKRDYKKVEFGQVGRVAVVFAVVAAALLVFDYLGFFLSTGLMIITLMLVMGERRKFLMAATACVWMAATWAVFNKFLLLGLPVGRLFTR